MTASLWKWYPWPLFVMIWLRGFRPTEHEQGRRQRITMWFQLITSYLRISYKNVIMHYIVKCQLVIKDSRLHLIVTFSQYNFLSSTLVTVGNNYFFINKKKLPAELGSAWSATSTSMD